jgi:DNA-binding CsgD family transcriptional regulator
MKYGLQEVSLRALMRRNWMDTEVRIQINQAKVAQYATEKAEGAIFPPPVVFVDPKTELFWVGDGFHRILADEKRQKKTMEVDLRRGTRHDAILHNIEANRLQRGLPWNTGDKTRAVEMLLADEEASKWTQTKIAETVGCAQATVSFIVKRFNIERPAKTVGKDGRVITRREGSFSDEAKKERKTAVAALYSQGLSQPSIARQLHVSWRTIANDIAELTGTGEFVKCPHCHGTGKIKREAKNGKP